jgi:hypothetical protein
VSGPIAEGRAVTLEQFHAIRHWHQGHFCPIEKQVWDAVVTLWVSGWMAIPVVFLIGRPLLAGAGIVAWFLPGAYVVVRRRLHRAAWLRCDWITAVR